MKKKQNLLIVGILLLLLFIAVSVLTFRYSNKTIENGYLASEGKAAEDFAVLTASNIHLSDARVRELKAMPYDTLLSSEENTALQEMMDNDNFTNKVDYAYVMIHLKKSDIKYTVNEANSSLFDAPLGTPLDIMWLLDVNVSDAAKAAGEAEEIVSLEDVQRYSYYVEADDHIFNDAPTYTFYSSEWGRHICGYAPLYSTEGNYIGVVGVDLQTSDYDTYRMSALRSIGILLTTSTLTLSFMFAVLYFKYRRLQYEKIYTDPLTGISNRSFYNDQFIKHLNNSHIQGHCFVMMIADIDWFKKVNDTFGHEVGDQVLIELSQLLLETFGKSNVVRFGGEEFVVSLWAKDVTVVTKKLETLYSDIASRRFSSRQIDISISLGCCYTCTYADNMSGWLLSGMLKAADFKLYEAKENGRKQYRIVAYSKDDCYDKKTQ